MLKAVFFDLDGTLVPMNDDEFTKCYFSLLCKKIVPYGFDKDELIKTIWAGTKEIRKNDGTKPNDEVFWSVFSSVYGEDVTIKIKPVFDEFYLNEFKQSKAVCLDNPKAREVVDFCKENGIKLVVSTSPFFPKVGVVSRLEFVGLSEKDFDYITHYENTTFAKPSINFYKEIMANIGVEPNEVVMFGNSELDDGLPMRELGAKAYMVGDYVALNENEKEHFEKVSWNDVIEVLKKEIKI